MKKIVLAHDSFIQFGGAERVFKRLMQLFPEAEILTLAKSPKFDAFLSGRKVSVSFAQKIYDIVPNFKLLLFALPAAIKNLRVPENSILLSSSSLFLKNLRVPKSSAHLAYTHTPPRFLWSEPEYLKQEVPLLLRPITKVFLSWLKKYDLNGSKIPSMLLANSAEVQSRISKFYSLNNCEIIHPFVDTEFWTLPNFTPTKDYFLVAGRLAAHKHNDKIVEAFKSLPELKLIIAGEGPDLKRLQTLAAGLENIKFFGKPNDEELKNLYQNARALIYIQYEDFGIMPLEASACGTPTLALAKGGSLETVISGITGELINQVDPEHIKNGVNAILNKTYYSHKLRVHSENFNMQKFDQKINDLVSKFRS